MACCLCLQASWSRGLQGVVVGASLWPGLAWPLQPHTPAQGSGLLKHDLEAG